MYKNIGEKIKGLAFGLAITSAILSFVGGIVWIVISVDNSYGIGVVLGLFTMILGPVFSWISSWVLYGFGELIGKATDIEKNTNGLDKNFATRIR